MASKERELLEKISNGEMSWGPENGSREALERFQVEAEDLKATLASLRASDFIGDYSEHSEQWSGHRNIDRIYIKGGLTLKGQDREQWPE